MRVYPHSPAGCDQDAVANPGLFLQGAARDLSASAGFRAARRATAQVRRLLHDCEGDSRGGRVARFLPRAHSQGRVEHSRRRHVLGHLRVRQDLPCPRQLTSATVAHVNPSLAPLKFPLLIFTKILGDV